MLRARVKKRLKSFDLEFSLEIGAGEFVMLTGPSGSGKTTLLRILAGLERGEGVVEVDGQIWQDRSRFLPPQRRGVSFVFQDYALFPNMSVLQNLLYVQKDRSLAMELLEMVDLVEYQDRYPHTLSGGQKQRVALARAMMKRPRLMLLDEPLSALDPKSRSYLQGKIQELHEAFGVATLMVSHDIAEIYRLGERIFRMERGSLTPLGKNRLVQSQIYKAEVVDLVDGGILVGFMGGIYQIATQKSYRIGQIVDVRIEELALGV
ncbi:MAG: molybdenum ABC transporter ATP-binding protein [Epsilonproteobacteria bacterium]|nr:molybdenum ABC transporter ATP-binding protein [Campylobacterota bacterium]NPA64065.1 ATP-binding cassette domain-containing protein [Campylobacterota bacterium]